MNQNLETFFKLLNILPCYLCEKINATYHEKSASISPQKTKTQILPFCRFSCNLCTILEILWLEGSRHSKKNKLPMQLTVLKRFAVLSFKNTSKMTPMNWKREKSKQNAKFRDVSIIGRMQTFNSEQIRYRESF